MRTTLTFAFALGAFVSPLGAQAQQKITIIEGDTLVTIERGDKTACSVKISDRTLGDAAAKSICDEKQRHVVLFGDALTLQRKQFDELRDKLGRLDMTIPSESMMKMQEQYKDLAKQLQSQSLALSKEGAALALRSRDLADMKVFGNLMGDMTVDRGFIGVTVDPRPRDTDRYGAYITAVTPNYPADKAGIRAGDIITSVDGQSLTKGRTERAAGSDESFPWIRLTEVVGKLEPGKTVDLEYRRDNANRKTRITPVADNRLMLATTEPQGGNFEGVFVAPRMAGVPGGVTVPDAPRGFGSVWTTPPTATSYNVAPTAGGSFSFAFMNTLGDLELAPMNSGLGEYFGTTKGVLVVDAPEKDGLGLKAGDVVTAVDGRSVDTPAELIRVLRTYDADKSFTLTITRKRQQQSINTKLPNSTMEPFSRGGMGGRLRTVAPDKP